MEFFVNEGIFLDYLKNYFKDLKCNFYLVQAEYKGPETKKLFSDFRGLDLALALPEDKPIIFCSFMPETFFVKSQDMSSKFFALMAKNRVGFLDVISPPEGFYNLYKFLLKNQKEKDLLAIHLERDRRKVQVLGEARHAIANLIGNETFYEDRLLEMLNKARAVGLMGSNDEVLKQILSFENTFSRARFAGHYFPGVFCDLEGTLFIDNALNIELFNKLKDFSKTKSITLWTAGNVEDYKDKLIEQGVLWKLVSKHDFFGAEVEIAFDDYSYERFQREFGVKVRNFNQISSGNEDLALRLKFLHSLLVSTGVDKVLEDVAFLPIFRKKISDKEILEYVKEMKEQDEDDYNHTLTIIRDFLLADL